MSVPPPPPDRFNEGLASGLFLSPSLTTKRKQNLKVQQEQGLGGGEDTRRGLFRRRKAGVAIPYLVIVTVLAVLFLVSRCSFLSRQQQQQLLQGQQPATRILAAAKGTEEKDDGDGGESSFLQQVCEGTEETQQQTRTSTGPERDTVNPSDIFLSLQALEPENGESSSEKDDDDDGEPPKKMKRMNDEGPLDYGALSVLSPVLAEADAGAEATKLVDVAAPATTTTKVAAAEAMRQDILKYVEEILAEGNDDETQKGGPYYSEFLMELEAGGGMHIRDEGQQQNKSPRPRMDRFVSARPSVATETISPAASRSSDNKDAKGSIDKDSTKDGGSKQENMSRGKRTEHRVVEKETEKEAEAGTETDDTDDDDDDDDESDDEDSDSDTGDEGPSSQQQQRQGSGSSDRRNAAAAASPLPPAGMLLVNPLGRLTEEQETEVNRRLTLTKRTVQTELVYVLGNPEEGGAYKIVCRKLQFQEKPALLLFSVPLPMSPEGAEAAATEEAAAPPQGQPRPDLRSHPFFRLPSVSADASVRPLQMKKWELLRRRTLSETNALLAIKNILKKQQPLTSNDLLSLMENLELLVEHIIHLKPETVDMLSPKFITEKQSIALLLTDAMYCAAEVLGDKARKGEWWKHAVNAIPVYRHPKINAATRGAAQRNLIIGQLLQSALQFYRKGKRPPAQLLVPLKQIILCTPSLPTLRRGPWARFEADDDEWRLEEHERQQRRAQKLQGQQRELQQAQQQLQQQGQQQPQKQQKQPVQQPQKQQGQQQPQEQQGQQQLQKQQCQQQPRKRQGQHQVQQQGQQQLQKQPVQRPQKQQGQQQPPKQPVQRPQKQQGQQQPQKQQGQRQPQKQQGQQQPQKQQGQQQPRKQPVQQPQKQPVQRNKKQQVEQQKEQQAQKKARRRVQRLQQRVQRMERRLTRMQQQQESAPRLRRTRRKQQGHTEEEEEP
ncbi:hypothetical protein EBH_0027260 [Eimeria brunetti]|uniref:Uncharacterized protein n=1 Tax=Eimeria brunetti TaxID=51314 RepID=U6LGR8_9EIME|nr:hypothetical protein EBH_0027260 [Eimeria brunetti]